MTDPDQEGYIKLLEDAGLDLPTIIPEKKAPAVPPKKSAPSEERDWQEDPVPAKWDKIRSAFYNAKTADEVEMEASTMPVQSWLELGSRMAPKQIDVNTVQITAIRVELPPVDGADDNIIDVEVPR